MNIGRQWEDRLRIWAEQFPKHYFRGYENLSLSYMTTMEHLSYDDAIAGELDPTMAQKIAGEGVTDENLSILNTPSYENLCRFVLEYADGVVIGSSTVPAAILDMARNSGKPILEYQSPDEADFFDNYNRFYEQIQ
jgi:hypothetical protein